MWDITMVEGRGVTMRLRKGSTIKSGPEEKTKATRTKAQSRKRRIGQEPQQYEKRRRTTSNQEGSHTVGSTGELEDQFNKLVCEFGDCDPDFIRHKLVLLKKGSQRYNWVRQLLLTTYKTYPKLREKLRRQHVAEQREILGNRLTLAEYIKRRSLIKFKGEERTDKVYLRDVLTYLGNTFRFLRVSYIRKVVGTDGLQGHIYNQLKIADEAVSRDLPNRPALRFVYTAPRSSPIPYPQNEFSEVFYIHKFYLENKAAIDDYNQQLEDATNDESVSESTSESFGVSETECPVCLLLEPTDQMVSCQDGEHLFCRTCVGSYLKEQQTVGKGNFICLSTDCNELLPLPLLQEYLHDSSYRQAQLRTREKELLRSQVKGLEWCPQCPYGVVFPPDSKQTILQCENPDCLVATCRQCRDPAHIPYSCEERAQASRVMRHYIENEMSEAVIRKCPKCETRFVKDQGCNRVQCSNCDLVICYSCGKKMSQCAKRPMCKITNTSTLHDADIKRIIPLAEKLFKKAHPEAEEFSFAADFLKYSDEKTHIS